ncbi:hypothetical protein I3843_04G124200 [Carya illinoinensis]|uniref:RING-type domain-containing protein n=1 Tax=Carya illinoinensis TaxID=32201 RepID=A0A8T1QSX9_CARIL|nr:E3 ubiquitin-protein ligase DZIP3 [Carya illinoinensis]KAG6658068.1 hypothetical protein CIPAW_04G134800 [Carya illinoinensis]KAG7983784.1 hypothetical protein I3843_04G124200 [Carya illinoinensis]
MSSGANNSWPLLWTRQPQLDYGAYAADHIEPSRVRPIPTFPRSPTFQVTPDVRAGARPPSQSFEDRRITGPSGMSSFPAPTLSSMQIVVLDNNMTREANPRRSQIIQDRLSRYTGQQNRPVFPTLADDSRLTQDEQNKALKMLKKETYNPTAKAISKRLNFYYKNNDKGSPSKELEKLKDEDAKSCTICLDDFEPREEVAITPCNHMFHEDCILPWLKSHGQCPVCRYAFCERMESTTARNLNNTNIANVGAANDLFAGELLSIIRALEDVFEWGNPTAR